MKPSFLLQLMCARIGLRDTLLGPTRRVVGDLELQILLLLDRRKFVPIARIRESLGIGATHFSPLQRRLVWAGYIEGEREFHDRRCKRIRLRPAGAQIVGAARARTRHLDEALRAEWGVDRSMNFVRDLKGFGRWVRSQRNAIKPHAVSVGKLARAMPDRKRVERARL